MVRTTAMLQPGNFIFELLGYFKQLGENVLPQPLLMHLGVLPGTAATLLGGGGVAVMGRSIFKWMMQERSQFNLLAISLAGTLLKYQYMILLFSAA
jgi:hypothetical protein